MGNPSVLTRQIVSLRAEVARLVESNIRPNFHRFDKYEGALQGDQNGALLAVKEAIASYKKDIGVGFMQALPEVAKFFEFVQASDEAITCFRGITENIEYYRVMANEINRRIHEEYTTAIKAGEEIGERLKQEIENAYLNTDRPKNRELYSLFHPQEHLSTYGQLKKRFEPEEDNDGSRLSLHRAIIETDNDELDRLNYLRLTLLHDLRRLRILRSQGYSDLSRLGEKKRALIAKKKDIAKNRKKNAYGGVSFEEYFASFQSFVESLSGKAAEIIVHVCSKMALFDVPKYQGHYYEEVSINEVSYRNYLRQWVNALRNYCLLGGEKREDKE